MGYFFAAVCIIISLFWIYRGLRGGLYPALKMFLVFLISLLVTLNYYGLAISLAGKIAPTLDLKMREFLAFVGTFLLVYVFFLYFVLWLCAENMKLQTVVDMAGGGILGALNGITCSGVLMMFWFSTPFAERNFPVDDAEMFYPTHKIFLRMATTVGSAIKGDRAFSGTRFMRDLRFGVPGIPGLNDGYFVSSVPTGLRVFMGGSGDPRSFFKEITGYLGKAGQTIPPSEKRRVGDWGRTPVFIEAPGEQALIAIVDDRWRSDRGGAPKFLPDGAVAEARKKHLNLEVVIRFYQVKKEGNIGTLVALFQPQDVWKDADETREAMLELLPSRNCYHFDESQMVTKLMKAGATDTEARKLAPLVKLGGKIGFAGAGNRVAYVEVFGANRFDTFTPPDPENLDDVQDPNMPGR